MAPFAVFFLFIICCCQLICLSVSQFAAWPQAKNCEKLPSTRNVGNNELKDYGGKCFVGWDGSQAERQKPMFQLGDGATLRNVVLAGPAADGVHCDGTCTLENVWWMDVGEDAATFRSGGDCSPKEFRVIGGGAKSAADKVFMLDGAGTLIIKNFQAENIGKLARSCGNCKKQCKNRKFIVDNVRVSGLKKSLVGVNSNYGDSATISNVKAGSSGAILCQRFQGIEDPNNEPVENKPSYKVGQSGDGKTCILYNNSA